MPFPRWWLKNRFVNTGKGRLDKWIPWVSPEDLCLTCDAEIKSSHKHYVQGRDRWQCHGCWLKQRNSVTESVGTGMVRSPLNWNRDHTRGFVNATRGVELSDEGNLTKWKYRFWIGTRYTGGCIRVCRCCRKAGYTQLFDAEHQDERSPSCCSRMVEAYKYLLQRKLCVVCKTKTHKEDWGIPICSNACELEWKFNNRTRWDLMEEALKATGGYVQTAEGMYSNAQVDG